MTCSHCGQNNSPGAAFCNGCGTSLTGASAGGPPPGQPAPTGMPPGPPPPGQPPNIPSAGLHEPPAAPPRTSGMAIAGFVLSFFCGLLGLIFSIVGHNECKRSLGAVTGEGFAIAGIIISSLNMLIGLGMAVGG